MVCVVVVEVLYASILVGAISLYCNSSSTVVLRAIGCTLAGAAAAWLLLPLRFKMAAKSHKFSENEKPVSGLRGLGTRISSN